MKKYVRLALLLAFSLFFQPFPVYSQDIIFSGGVATYQGTYRFQQFVYPEATVATLPSNPTSGQTVIVTDGADATDCDTGGGATYIDHCTWNGSAWIFAGGGNGAQLDGDSQLLASYLPEEWMRSQAGAPGAGASLSTTNIWFESTTPTVYFGFAASGNMYHISDLTYGWTQMTGTDSVSKKIGRASCR